MHAFKVANPRQIEVCPTSFTKRMPATKALAISLNGRAFQLDAKESFVEELSLNLFAQTSDENAVVRAFNQVRGLVKGPVDVKGAKGVSFFAGKFEELKNAWNNYRHVRSHIAVDETRNVLFHLRLWEKDALGSSLQVYDLGAKSDLFAFVCEVDCSRILSKALEQDAYVEKLLADEKIATSMSVVTLYDSPHAMVALFFACGVEVCIEFQTHDSVTETTLLRGCYVHDKRPTDRWTVTGVKAPPRNYLRDLSSREAMPSKTVDNHPAGMASRPQGEALQYGAYRHGQHFFGFAVLGRSELQGVDRSAGESRLLVVHNGSNTTQQKSIDFKTDLVSTVGTRFAFDERIDEVHSWQSKLNQTLLGMQLLHMDDPFMKNSSAHQPIDLQAKSDFSFYPYFVRQLFLEPDLVCTVFKTTGVLRFAFRERPVDRLASMLHLQTVVFIYGKAVPDLQRSVCVFNKQFAWTAPSLKSINPELLSFFGEQGPKEVVVLLLHMISNNKQKYYVGMNAEKKALGLDDRTDQDEQSATFGRTKTGGSGQSLRLVSLDQETLHFALTLLQKLGDLSLVSPSEPKGGFDFAKGGFFGNPLRGKAEQSSFAGERFFKGGASSHKTLLHEGMYCYFARIVR